MKSRRANPVKIGAFVVGGIAILVAAVAARSDRAGIFRARISFVSYFEGSVNGLRDGASVKFKGVELGKVSRIRIPYWLARTDPPIAVFFALDGDKLEDVRGAAGTDRRRRCGARSSKGLRAQLETDSIVTGVLHVSLAFMPDSRGAPARSDRGRAWRSRPSRRRCRRSARRCARSSTAWRATSSRSCSTSLKNALDGVAELSRAPEVRSVLSSLDRTLKELESLIQHLDPLASQLLSLAQRADALGGELQAGVGDARLTLASVQTLSAELRGQRPTPRGQPGEGVRPAAGDDRLRGDDAGVDASPARPPGADRGRAARRPQRACRRGALGARPASSCWSATPPRCCTERARRKAIRDDDAYQGVLRGRPRSARVRGLLAPLASCISDEAAWCSSRSTSCPGVEPSSVVAQRRAWDSGRSPCPTTCVVPRSSRAQGERGSWRRRRSAGRSRSIARSSACWPSISSTLLGVGRVVPHPWYATERPDVQIEVAFSRFERDESGRVRGRALEAALARWNAGRPRERDPIEHEAGPTVRPRRWRSAARWSSCPRRSRRPGREIGSWKQRRVSSPRLAAASQGLARRRTHRRDPHRGARSTSRADVMRTHVQPVSLQTRASEVPASARL